MTDSASPAAASPSGSTSPTSTPDETPDGETAARDVYVDWATHYLAGQHMSKQRRRDFLAKWMIYPALSEYVDVTQRQLDQHTRIDGTRVPHVFSVEPSGAGGQGRGLHCGRRLKDTRTGEEIDAETVDFLWVTAWLTDTDEGW